MLDVACIYSDLSSKFNVIIFMQNNKVDNFRYLHWRYNNFWSWNMNLTLYMYMYLLFSNLCFLMIAKDSINFYSLKFESLLKKNLSSAFFNIYLNDKGATCILSKLHSAPSKNVSLHWLTSHLILFNLLHITRKNIGWCLSRILWESLVVLCHASR